MKFLGKSNALCLSPHPDDVEYSMSGVMKMYPETKFYVMLLSYGISTDKTTGVVRYMEMKNFYKTYNCDNVKLIDYTVEFKYKFIGAIIDQIDLVIDEANIDILFTPSNNDSNQDHRFVRGLADIICRDGRGISMVEYRAPSALNWNPNLSIRLSDSVYLSKREALLEYVSQLDSSYFIGETVHQFHRDFFLEKVGAGTYKETFNIVRLLQ